MRLLAVFLLLSVSAACGIDGDPVGQRSEPLRDLDAYEQAFLELLNEYRQANGVGEVMAERALNDGAHQYSQLMGETNWFDHEGPDGSVFHERMCVAGYDPGCGPRTWVAENIAAGQWDAASVFEAWRTSPGHNANMLSDEAVVVGIGRAEVSGSEYGVYWTNTFGGTVTANAVPSEPEPEPDAGPPPMRDAGPVPVADAGMPSDTDAGDEVGSDAGSGTRGLTIPRGRRDRSCAVAHASGDPSGALFLALPLLWVLFRRRR